MSNIAAGEGAEGKPGCSPVPEKTP
uniref:Uncharacterized protein n=1 Tax=Arundo donax TaxID=35708 RepID=A0A0A9BUS7_ARUDO